MQHIQTHQYEECDNESRNCIMTYSAHWFTTGMNGLNEEAARSRVSVNSTAKIHNSSSTYFIPQSQHPTLDLNFFNKYTSTAKIHKVGPHSLTHQTCYGLHDTTAAILFTVTCSNLRWGFLAMKVENTVHNNLVESGDEDLLWNDSHNTFHSNLVKSGDEDLLLWE